jgi:hypothetical protein
MGEPQNYERVDAKIFHVPGKKIPPSLPPALTPDRTPFYPLYTPITFSLLVSSRSMQCGTVSYSECCFED